MPAANETFFISIGCMDGQVHNPVISFGKKKWGVKYGDIITEVGLVSLLVKEESSSQLRDSIKKKILLSLEKHHPAGIIIHGHQECAGNPASDEEQKEYILKSAAILSEFLPDARDIVPVFVKRGGDGWVIEELAIT